MITLIWGAGREGRGFLADVFRPVSDELHLVDTDSLLIDQLRAAGQYRLLLRPPDAPASERFVSDFAVWHAGDRAVQQLVLKADVIALCIYLEDMPDAVKVLAQDLAKRRTVNPDKQLDIFICANSIHFGPALRELFHEHLPKNAVAWFDQSVGIVETLVRRTCVVPDDENAHDPLAIMTNGFPTLAVDSAGVKGWYDNLPFLAPVDDMRMEERRKIYTYNLLHATYAYLGFPKGYEFINQSRDDRDIQMLARNVYAESSAALIKAYGLDTREMAAYEQTMWSYVVNPAMPDSVTRTGCNPVRKLERNERIIGPAAMCLDNNLPFSSIATVAAHAFAYDNPDDTSALFLRSEIAAHGIRACVEKFCGLDAQSPIADAIVDVFGNIRQTLR